LALPQRLHADLSLTRIRSLEPSSCDGTLA
jgi:hypothetical protein